MQQTVGTFILGMIAIVIGVIDAAVKWPWPWWIPVSLGLACILGAVLMFWRSRNDSKKSGGKKESQVPAVAPPTVTHSPTFIRNTGQMNNNKGTMTYIAGDSTTYNLSDPEKDSDDK